MKLLLITLFIIQLSKIDAESEPVSDESNEFQQVDCNNEEVELAVDFTLRKLNAEQATGNQFALYRIIEAEVQEEQGRHYSLTFSIRETDCPIVSTKIWKDCNYRKPREASIGQCKSNVFINKMPRKISVTSYNCTFQSDQQGVHEKPPCLGCVSPITNENHIINKTSSHATITFNNNSTYEHYFRIAEVYNLTQQVVAGMKYKMTFLNQETECSKDNPLPYENITSCPFKPDGRKLHCNSVLIEQVWLKYITGKVSCRPHLDDPTITLRLAGWGPFSRMSFSQKSKIQSNSTEVHSSAEDTAIPHTSTCPGEPWKPIHFVKPALPLTKEHHDSGEDESTEEHH
ncbi:kininogen-1-like [Narcine bancroftii]|uniref:kininogen-1-like n=1 Tax=Narcine bancroftii TaxID=1343680 RepID=UPI0038315A95